MQAESCGGPQGHCGARSRKFSLQPPAAVRVRRRTNLLPLKGGRGSFKRLLGGRGSLVWSDEITGYSPRSLALEHRDDRLHHLSITRDARLVLEEHILASWRIGEVSRVSGHDLAPRPERFKGPASLLYCLHPLRLRGREAVESQTNRLASEGTQFFPTRERPAASSAC